MRSRLLLNISQGLIFCRRWIRVLRLRIYGQNKDTGPGEGRVKFLIWTRSRSPWSGSYRIKILGRCSRYCRADVIYPPVLPNDHVHSISQFFLSTPSSTRSSRDDGTVGPDTGLPAIIDSPSPAYPPMSSASSLPELATDNLYLVSMLLLPHGHFTKGVVDVRFSSSPSTLKFAWRVPSWFLPFL